MKTPEEIRARIALLTQRIDQPQRRLGQAAIVALVHAQDALEWALDEHAEDAAWSMQRCLDAETP